MATRIGNGNNNILRGTNTEDFINGLGGNDYLIGLDGNDTISGGAGNDIIFGGIEFLLDLSADWLGLPQNLDFDTDIQGNEGSDVIISRGTVDAGDDDDVIVGGDVFSDAGSGNDILINTSGSGGIGDDLYIFTQASNALSRSFDIGANRLVISGTFSGDVNLGRSTRRK